MLSKQIHKLWVFYVVVAVSLGLFFVFFLEFLHTAAHKFH